MSVQHHAALLAWHTGKPVKLTLSRDESLRVHPKRHPMEMEYTTACDENGKLTAVRVAHCGRHGRLCVAGRAGVAARVHACRGPYQIDNVDIEGRAIYTNNIPSGAMRGFGVTQTCFAMESNLNLLARAGGHFAVGDSVSQCHRTGRRAFERADCRRRHGAERDAAGGEGRDRCASRCGHCLRIQEHRQGRGREGCGPREAEGGEWRRGRDLHERGLHGTGDRDGGGADCGRNDGTRQV